MDKKLLLLYQFDESELRFTLFETDELKHTIMLHTVSHLGPEADIYGDEYEAEEDELPPGLREAMASDLDAFMMEKYLRSLGIFGDTEQDEEAFDNLHKSEAEVRKKLRSHSKANIVYKNWYLEINEDYPIERFEKVFLPILYRNDRYLEDFFQEAGVEPENIDTVMVTGSECEYPFVRKHLTEVLEREVIHVTRCPRRREKIRGEDYYEEKNY